ncbi:biotin/lipoate A/B protein ligase family protein [Kamptonema sp. UHCC 0994]|uniref:lipoate--protein ligase family protein n=1 Tax=Kamptonema sp. UHCC 0994 TaxID=3031329 RepID=UPI0023B94B22|nr:biotin/lipoate A/B protein ligase family protein [Kamptonema sp. UHCC 0994]MDF0552153.1 biotin/lipoate A/B protein ligase family protein [Kamptonema sp. UHCC 0994]
MWRIIPLMQASGTVQMAIDEWLLEQHHLGKHPPTLRFYTWEPAAISLGYHQRRWPEFWQEITWQGMPLELVKRPSGGRAVLHQGDLTYAVIASGLGSNRTEAYQIICQFLIEGWRSLGLDLDYGSAGRGYIHNPNCFGTATGADLVLTNGCKFIGSAQLRRGNAILQHGSMRLQPDCKLFYQVFGEEIMAVEFPFFKAKPPSGRLIDRPEGGVTRHISVEGETLIEIVVEALTLAAKQCFNIELVVQPLSEKEWESILLMANG